MHLPPRSKKILLAVAAAIVALGCAIIVARKSAPVASPAAFTLSIAPTEPAAPADGPKDHATTVLELFNPSDSALTHQLNETNVSQQIEQVMATSFVLTNCKLIKANDYANSYYASIVYAQRMKLAPDKKTATAKVHKITESAGASYALIYSRTQCTDPKLPRITEQLLAWQKAYLAD